MSYLPRMSKTYKEPEERNYEDATKEITFNNIPIASALPDEKAFNPQTVLKQYNFYPHPPPQLPGPSLIEEAEQNERISVGAKRRRTREDSDNLPDTTSMKEFPYKTKGEEPAIINIALAKLKLPNLDNEEEMLHISANTGENIRTPPKKVPLNSNMHKTELGRSGTTTLDSIHETEEMAATLNAVNTESIPPQSSRRKSSNAENEIRNVSIVHEKPENSVKCLSSLTTSVDLNTTGNSGSANVEDETKNSHLTKISKISVHQGVQCYPLGLNEKIFITPCCVHNLMKTLSFLINEVDKNEEHGNFNPKKEVNKLLKQINEAITGLLSSQTNTGYVLQTSVSDSKRLEKIYSDLEEYMKLVYGEKGKFGHKSEEKKNIYCKLSQKNYELKFLHEKLGESEIQNPTLKPVNCATKSLEVVLQNKNLENEQLTAEIEFNNEELQRFYQALAEKNWEIQKSKEEILELKKEFAILKSRFKK